MTTNAPTPYIIRTTTGMELTMYDYQVPVFQEEEFKVSVPNTCTCIERLENVNSFSCFLSWISREPGQSLTSATLTYTKSSIFVSPGAPRPRTQQHADEHHLQDDKIYTVKNEHTMYLRDLMIKITIIKNWKRRNKKNNNIRYDMSHNYFSLYNSMICHSWLLLGIE